MSMSPDVRQLLDFLRVPEFRYREFSAWPSRASLRPRGEVRAFTIVALASLVPGVGRTTLAANLASALSRRGRCAAVDLDPKADLERHFGAVATVPGGDASLVRWTASGIGCVPFGADPALALESLAASCDVALLDTPADPRSEHLQQALAEADEVLVVVRPDARSIGAVRATEELLARVRRAWRRRRARYLVNHFDARRRLDRDAVAALRSLVGARLVPVFVQQDEAVRAAFASARPLEEVAPGSQVVADLAALAREIVPRRERRRRHAVVSKRNRARHVRVR
jgi:cellulose synthase operon protein YhjQ